MIRLYPPQACTSCTFLGTYRHVDLYHCPQGGIPTLIARYGVEGHRYESLMVEMVERAGTPNLIEAYRRAVEKGLICEATG